MGTKCTQYSKGWKFYCSVIRGLRLSSDRTELAVFYSTATLRGKMHCNFVAVRIVTLSVTANVKQAVLQSSELKTPFKD